MRTNLTIILCALFGTLFQSFSSLAQNGVSSVLALRHKTKYMVIAEDDQNSSPRSSFGRHSQERVTGLQNDCISSEPSPLELVKAAWEQAGLKKEREVSLKNRVRISAWFPRLTGGLSYDVGDKWDYKYEPGEPRVDQLHQNDGLSWDVGMTLDLARTVYQAEELAIARESARRAGERRDLALEVIRLVYARRQLMIEGPPELGSTERNQLDEFTAVLDAWTGGIFQTRWCTKEVSQ